MIVELLQLLDLVLHGTVRYLGLFFLGTTTVIAATAVKARMHRPYVEKYKTKTSTIVTCYREHLLIFDQCLQSIRPHTDQLIVVIDEPTAMLESTAREYADIVLTNEKRQGKRRCYAQASQHCTHPTTILLDSDTTIEPHTIMEIVKPLNNPQIAYVQGHPDIAENADVNSISKSLSDVLEQNRDVVCRALNPHLIVVDGRLQAIRTSLFQQIAPQIAKETWLGRPQIIGEDTATTLTVHRAGYQTAYQPTATCHTEAPLTVIGYVKQQLRWMRSGIKYFLNDLWHRKIPSRFYGIHGFTYYMGPLLFTLAILLDLTVAPKLPFTMSPYLAVLAMMMGTISVTYLHHTLRLGNVPWIRGIVYALIGTFIMYPTMLYAWLTIHKQGAWLTR